MIRFIDLSKEYWTDPEYGFPLCAFLSTTTDTFLKTLDDIHVFRASDIEEYPDKDVQARMRALTPPGFWENNERARVAGRGPGEAGTESEALGPAKRGEREGLKDPETVLTEIKEAAAQGNITMGSDSVTAQLNAEIQEIFRALYLESTRGREPKRPIWTSNEGTVGVLFSGWDPETKKYPAGVYAVCEKVGWDLGITIRPENTWVEVASALRAIRANEKGSAA